MSDAGKRPGRDANEVRDRVRLRGLAVHFAVYFVVMTVLVAINVMLTPDSQWAVLPMVGWGSVLAVHVALVMGLFDGLRGK